MQLKPISAKPATPDFSSLPDDAFIRESGLIPGVLPISRGTLWRWVKNGDFPAPVRLSPGVTAWRVGAVRAHLANMA